MPDAPETQPNDDYLALHTYGIRHRLGQKSITLYVTDYAFTLLVQKGMVTLHGYDMESNHALPHEQGEGPST